MKFEQFIQQNKEQMEYDEDLSSVWKEIETNMIANQNPQKTILSRNLILVALVIFLSALLAYFAFTCNQFNSDKRSSNKASYATLENQEPLQRILTIKTNQFPDKNQEQIIETLLSIVENDKNTNVRLAAIRSLEKFIGVEKVKISFIELLVDEEEPYLTVAIMNILQRGKVIESLPAFNRVIETENRMNFVKEEAIKSQDLLKNI